MSSIDELGDGLYCKARIFYWLIFGIFFFRFRVGVGVGVGGGGGGGGGGAKKKSSENDHLTFQTFFF